MPSSPAATMRASILPPIGDAIGSRRLPPRASSKGGASGSPEERHPIGSEVPRGRETTGRWPLPGILCSHRHPAHCSSCRRRRQPSPWPDGLPPVARRPASRWVAWRCATPEVHARGLLGAEYCGLPVQAPRVRPGGGRGCRPAEQPAGRVPDAPLVGAALSGWLRPAPFHRHLPTPGSIRRPARGAPLGPGARCRGSRPRQERNEGDRGVLEPARGVGGAVAVPQPLTEPAVSPTT